MSIAALEGTATLLDALRAALGADGLLDDEKSRDFYANDVFWQPGIPPLAIALPRDRDQVAAAIRAAHDAGVAVVPRGGGMSYTKGYLPKRPDSVVIDSRRLNRIVELNTDSLYVTVETGCTWAALN